MDAEPGEFSPPCVTQGLVAGLFLEREGEELIFNGYGDVVMIVIAIVSYS